MKRTDSHGDWGSSGTGTEAQRIDSNGIDSNGTLSFRLDSNEIFSFSSGIDSSGIDSRGSFTRAANELVEMLESEYEGFESNDNGGEERAQKVESATTAAD